MSPTTFYLSLLVAWTLCYLVLPLWLASRGWIIACGMLQFFGALLPGIWQQVFWPDAAGNLILPMMMLVPVPFGVIVIGSIMNLVRVSAWTLKLARRA